MYIMIVVSTGRTWWIGGEKISGTWYWKGITTSRIPETIDGGSGWHSGHHESSEPPCMYYQTSGTGGSDNGWNSHSHSPCSTNMYFICERLF